MAQPIIHGDPDIQRGLPVFHGTRVPVKNLFDYLEASDSFDQFPHSFPSVSRQQAVAALELAWEALSPMRILLDESLPTDVPLRTARL